MRVQSIGLEPQVPRAGLPEMGGFPICNTLCTPTPKPQRLTPSQPSAAGTKAGVKERLCTLNHDVDAPLDSLLRGEEVR